MINKTGILLLVVCTMIISCDSKNSKSDLSDKSANNILSYIANSEKAVYISTTQEVIEGKFIKGSIIPFGNTIEYDSLKTLLNETLINSPHKMITYFNKNGKEVRFERYTNNILDIYQETKFNDKADILEEFRIEKTTNTFDTILYEYHYNYKNSINDYIAYRTNNKDTVTRYSVHKEGNKIFRTEEAYPNRGFTLIKNFEITINDQLKPIKIIEESISDLSDRKLLDTIYRTTIFKYDNEGNLIEEINKNNPLKANKIIMKYENKILIEKTIDNRLIKFTQHNLRK